MIMKKYEVTDDDSTTGSLVKAGTVVYDCKFYDYGCASDDSRSTGVEHISVTLDSEGDYPFFTIPKYKLKEI